MIRIFKIIYDQSKMVIPRKAEFIRYDLGQVLDTELDKIGFPEIKDIINLVQYKHLLIDQGGDSHADYLEPENVNIYDLDNCYSRGIPGDLYYNDSIIAGIISHGYESYKKV